MGIAAIELRGRFLLRLCLALCAVAALSWSPGAEARRAALIIGNSTYANAASLANPVNDVQLVASGARRAGFTVTLLTDLTKAGFDQALREFRQQADGAEVAMVYFAGHGIESGGNNWLLPVDVRLSESRDLRFEAVELDGLLETLIGAQLRMVVLDACRNNPFGSSWRGGARSTVQGLAETEIEGALVMFAAAGGQVATDGTGGNSPFARSFATRLAQPGLSIHRLGSAVLEDVAAATGGQQRPWTNMSIGSRDIYLVEAPQSAPAPVAVAAGGSPNATTDALMWQGAETANTLDGYQAYLGILPNGLFANMAKDRIAKLRGAASAAAMTAVPVAPPPAPLARAIPPVDPVPTPAPLAPAPIASAPAPVHFAPTPVQAAPIQAAPAPSAVALVLPTPRPDLAAAPAQPGLVTFNRLTDGAPLPLLPTAPRFAKEGYPDCREGFQAVVDPIGKVTEINRCMGLLDRYFETALNGFARSMIEHQQAISRIYSEKVSRQPIYTPESQERFYRLMMQDHAASNPGGANFAEQAEARARYDQDRTYLKDRYCFHTGSCGGYPVPPGVAPPAK